MSVDQTQLRELLGDAELRELLDADAIEQQVNFAQRLARPARGIDGLHEFTETKHLNFDGKPTLW